MIANRYRGGITFDMDAVGPQEPSAFPLVNPDAQGTIDRATRNMDELRIFHLDQSADTLRYRTGVVRWATGHTIMSRVTQTSHVDARLTKRLRKGGREQGFLTLWNHGRMWIRG